MKLEVRNWRNLKTPQILVFLCSAHTKKCYPPTSAPLCGCATRKNGSAGTETCARIILTRKVAKILHLKTKAVAICGHLRSKSYWWLWLIKILPSGIKNIQVSFIHIRLAIFFILIFGNKYCHIYKTADNPLCPSPGESGPFPEYGNIYDRLAI